MAKVPEDIKENLKKLSAKMDIPVKDLMARMKEIMAEDKSITGDSEKEKEFQIRFAWGVLYNEYSSRGNAIDCYIMPVNTPRANERKIKGEMTWVGDCTALIQTLKKDDDGNVEKSDVMYGQGVFWRDGAKNLNKMEKGKVYKAQLIVNESKSGWGVSISTDRGTFTPVDDVEFDWNKFFQEEILSQDIQITLGELDLNKSEDNTDIRLIRATVSNADVAESQKGNTYGFYAVMDDSIIGNSYRFFVSPEDVCWRIGSILYFGGTIDINDDTGEPTFRVQFIQPTEMAMPAEYNVRETGTAQAKEEVDLDAEEAKQETKEETTKDDSKDKKKSDEGELFDI